MKVFFKEKKHLNAAEAEVCNVHTGQKECNLPRSSKANGGGETFKHQWTIRWGDWLGTTKVQEGWRSEEETHYGEIGVHEELPAPRLNPTKERWDQIIFLKSVLEVSSAGHARVRYPIQWVVPSEFTERELHCIFSSAKVEGYVIIGIFLSVWLLAK